MILPGYGEEKATRLLATPWLVKCVMNNDSPVSIRFPMDINPPKIPEEAADPSPMRASKAMSDSIQFIAPASATTVSWGSNSISTAWRSSP